MCPKYQSSLAHQKSEQEMAHAVIVCYKFIHISLKQRTLLLCIFSFYYWSTVFALLRMYLVLDELERRAASSEPLIPCGGKCLQNRIGHLPWPSIVIQHVAWLRVITQSRQAQNQVRTLRHKWMKSLFSAVATKRNATKPCIKWWPHIHHWYHVLLSIASCAPCLQLKPSDLLSWVHLC